MYHQIRKMMGATVGVMNQSLSANFITEALQEDRTVNTPVPLAPAEGLVLVEAIFSKYCSKYKIEPIGLGTKLFYRDKINDGSSVQTPQWEIAAAKLLLIQPNSKNLCTTKFLKSRQLDIHQRRQI
jgi:hypothetical protein